MKKNETGRSMVEMLAVLSIIGVLSVGGVAGYTMAMNRYQAGQIFDFVLKSASETTGGGVATHTKSFHGVVVRIIGVNNNEAGLRDGDVCIEDWGGISEDVLDVFDQRMLPYAIADKEDCYRLTRLVD